MSDDFNPAPRFSMLSGLGREATSEGRRELLRKVTEVLAAPARSAAEMDEIDRLLEAVAADYSQHVRAEIARLVAGRGQDFARAAASFAMDDIAVAGPVLRQAAGLSDATLLKVINEKSQDHLMAVTQRPEISSRISQALVERGDDRVVSSLLKNEGAAIAQATYEAIALRAQNSPVLQAPLIRRKDAPLELLNTLYIKVEAKLRREILKKFENVPAADLENAFRRSRQHVSESFRAALGDFEASRRRVEQMEKQGALEPAALVPLLREGPAARTAFKIAFARLADVNIDLVERVIETRDVDAMALLCRGADFPRALFVTLALGLDTDGRAMGNAADLGRLYESVPVQAAQRALRFWKVRAVA